jgi:trehalose synthase
LFQIPCHRAARTAQGSQSRDGVFEVDLSARSLSPFVELVGAARLESLARHTEATRAIVGAHPVWNINSTATGGGVAEMLRSLTQHSRGLGIDARWLVIQGPPEFFRVTKRLHNALHDVEGDGSPLGDDQRGLYERVMNDNLTQLERVVRADDVVVCNDPQTAGLMPRLKAMGVRACWRCHIGHDGPGRYVDEGWAFLQKYLADVKIAVFSRAAYAPAWVPRGRAVTMPPNIDPFSVKNRWMTNIATRAILDEIGIVTSPHERGAAVFVRDRGTTEHIRRRAQVLRVGDAPSERVPLIVQVSRWDRMKDHEGVLDGFTKLLERPRDDGAELVLAGPSVAGVADDPEGPEVLRDVERAWTELSEAHRRRVHIVQLPMDDTEENAAMVNALQRHAAVVVQKSLREGFGLTVTEAMWKGRPVVASAVGGIQDQIRDGREGLLIHDPTDPAETASALERVLASTDLAERLGRAAHERVRERYLSISALERWMRLLQMLYS